MMAIHFILAARKQLGSLVPGRLNPVLVQDRTLANNEGHLSVKVSNWNLTSHEDGSKEEDEMNTDTTRLFLVLQ